jgi:hypothetical protein
MDLHNDELFSSGALAKNKASVITDKPLSPEFLKSNKANIKSIIIKANKPGLSSFAEEVKNNCIDLTVFSKLRGKALNDLKFEFLDVCHVKSEKIIKKEDIKEIDGVDINSLFYMPNKFILSEGKVYDNAHSLNKKDSIEKLTKKLTKVKYDHEDFWDESQHFCFLKKQLD